MRKIPGLISAQWPAPANVFAFSTTRLLEQGKSEGVYANFNLAKHVNDNAAQVEENRDFLAEISHLPSSPVWLNQVHGNFVHRIDSVFDESKNEKVEISIEADASVSRTKKAVCAVLTADCLPVFFCNQDGTEVAVAHAGWRGLHAGVLQKTVSAMQSKAGDLLVWFGPAIGPAVFEVGEEVRKAFVEQDASNARAFKPVDSNHFLCDLYLLARLALLSIGVKDFYGGEFCTFSDKSRFYSFRRDGETGRMANLIWFT